MAGHRLHLLGGKADAVVGDPDAVALVSLLEHNGRVVCLRQPKVRSRDRRHPVQRLRQPRERDVVRLLANGDRYSAIAVALSLSTATVRKLTGRIKTKLGAATPTEAVAVALRLSLIT